MRIPFIPLLLLLVITTSSTAFSQRTVIVRDAKDEVDMHLKVGVIGAATLSMNTTDYHVSMVSRSLGLGSHFGVRASIPIGGRTRVVGSLGYHTLTFSDVNERISFSDSIHNHSTNIPGKLNTDGTFQYVMLAVGFQFSQFYVTFGVGFPSAAELKNTPEGFTLPPEGIDPAEQWVGKSNLNPDGNRIRADITPTLEDINPLLELRFGGEFPIFKSPIGDLNFGISLAYTFNNIIKDSHTNLPKYEDQFHLPNVKFHLSYMFNI